MASDTHAFSLSPGPCKPERVFTSSITVYYKEDFRLIICITFFCFYDVNKDCLDFFYDILEQSSELGVKGQSSPEAFWFPCEVKVWAAPAPLLIVAWEEGWGAVLWEWLCRGREKEAEADKTGKK